MQFSQIASPETSEKCYKSYENWEKEKVPLSYPLWLSKRFIILILLFCGFFVTVICRIGINIAVIEMDKNKTIIIGNETHYIPPQYNWTSKHIATIIGSHSFGYLFSIVGGYVTTKFGGSVTYGGATLTMSLLTALNPRSLRFGFQTLIAVKILAGLFDGVAYVSTAEIFSRWIPESERARFMSIIFTGVYISAAVSYPICGYVAYYWGWKMIFYLAGGVGCLWSAIWLIIARDEPSEDRLISKKELAYILSQTETSARTEITHPYREILTSPPVWALGISKLIYGVGFSVIITYLPQYVKDMTHREINEIGVIASIPNFVCIIITPIIGTLMDYLQNKHNLKPSQIHKILMTFGFTTGSILFAVAALSVNFTVSMICFILIKLFLSLNFLILQLVCLYMAPKHSSVLQGFTASWYMISYIVVPSAVGFIVVNHTIQEWSMCFLLVAGLLMFGAIVYLIYGSSELQPWALLPDQDKNIDLSKDKDDS